MLLSDRQSVICKLAGTCIHSDYNAVNFRCTDRMCASHTDTLLWQEMLFFNINLPDRYYI
jgi:DNA polymerase IIIc chi subunit